MTPAMTLRPHNDVRALVISSSLLLLDHLVRDAELAGQLLLQMGIGYSSGPGQLHGQPR